MKNAIANTATVLHTDKTIDPAILEKRNGGQQQDAWQPPKEVHGLPVVGGNMTEKVIFVTATAKVAGVDFTINFGKSRKFRDGEGDFLPAKVFKAGEKVPVWDFSDEKKAPGVTMAHFFLFGDSVGEIEYVIGVIGRTEGEKRLGIMKVIPLADLGKIAIKRPDGSIIRVGGLSEEEALNLKVEVAKQMSWHCHPTLIEREILRVRKIEDGEANRAAHEATVREQEARAKAKEERRLQLESLRLEIMARKSVTVYTDDGRPRYGRPVTAEEWPVLKHDTKVVLFGKIEEGVPVGDPLESFTVRKDKNARKQGGFAKDWLCDKVFWQKPTASDSALLDRDGKDLWFMIDGRRERQPVFSRATIKQLHEQGVNGGTQFVVNEPDAEGRYPVISLSKKGIKNAGHYQSVQ